MCKTVVRSALPFFFSSSFFLFVVVLLAWHTCHCNQEGHGEDKRKEIGECKAFW